MKNIKADKFSMEIFQLGHLLISGVLLSSCLLFQALLKAPNISAAKQAYLLLFIYFLVQIVGTVVYERKGSPGVAHAWMGLGALLLSVWVVIAQASGSLIVFLYLVFILLGALSFQMRGGAIQAFLSTLFLGIAILQSQTINTGSIMSWGVYSLMFATVGLVGGYLSSELAKTSEKLIQKDREIESITSLFQQIIDCIPTGLLILDEKLVLRFANPGAEVILGRKTEEIINKDLKNIEPDLLPFFESLNEKKIPDESDDINEQGIETKLTSTGTEFHRSVFLSAKIKAGQARLQQTIERGNGKSKRLLRGDVAEVEMNSDVSGIFNQLGGRGKVLLFQDVTKIVHLEDKLKQHEKLAAVGQLAAGIAHEIRNPLASMFGSVQMLQESSGNNQLSEEDQKLMRIIKKEIERLNDLVSEFLNFVKPDKFEFKTVELMTLLSDIIFQSTHQSSQFPQVKILQELKPNIEAMGNSEKLRQVIWNLLANALQAMQGPGTISVGCDEVSPHWVYFWVEDQGEGMSEETLQHLYEPFFTTKPKGTGLGLATVYKIVEAHQGEIRVRSKKGEGTRFEVHLPKA